MKRFVISMQLIMMTTVMLFAQGNKTSKVPDYSMTARKDIPVNLTWKTDDIYANMDAWKADKKKLEAMSAQIDALGKDWTADAGKMLAFMKLSDDISILGEKLYCYVSLQSTADLSNTEFLGLKGEMQAFFVDLGSRLSFVNEDILKLGEDKFNQYLAKEPGLKPYAFGVQQVFRVKDHILPTEEQKIVSLAGLFSGSMGEASNVLSNVELPNPEVTLSDGSKVVLNVANYAKYRASKNPADRSIVMHAFWANYRKFENTFAALLNGEIKAHYFSAVVSKYPTCLDASLDGNNIDTKVYTQLISSVNAHLSSLHRYLKLKQELLGLEKYRYDDIYASAVKSVSKEYTYDEAVKLVEDAMAPLGDDYVSVLKKAFAERWVDIYPNKSKESGAFSLGVYGVHPFVKMNFNGEYDAVSTLAHELGHAMHSYYSSKNQPYSTNDYATFLAEIASTFNENMLMRQMLKTETDDMLKLYILDRYLDGVRGTIFRQTLFAEFELAMHTRVEEGQTLTADWLDAKYLELTRKYYGNDLGVCQVDDYIQNEWSYIPHFYMNYYVYQYATGIIASMALSENVLSGDPVARDKYLTFLKSGGSDYPLNILKTAGVDMTTSAPTDAAFKNFDNLVSEMEKIVERLKKAGKL
jgi:oligoendopeptidase F